ncbi:hypothetical protein WK13_34665 [Burkholderia ubonensis]|nr:hypothetical protein WK13_34665 [Burkholderia ubonensis]
MLVVIDKDQGMSVTNDIEGVVQYLCDKDYLTRNQSFIYRDTMGRYDGVRVTDKGFQGFVALQAPTVEEAIRRAREKHLAI